MKTFLEFRNMINEELSIIGRKKLKRSAKKRKRRLAFSRKLAKLKKASPAVIKKRADRRARAQIKKSMNPFGTKSLNNAALNRISTMVNSRHNQLDILRRKMLKNVRKDNISK